jgi:hypothetical protein
MELINATQTNPRFGGARPSPEREMNELTQAQAESQIQDHTLSELEIVIKDICDRRKARRDENRSDLPSPILRILQASIDRRNKLINIDKSLRNDPMGWDRYDELVASALRNS